MVLSVCNVCSQEMSFMIQKISLLAVMACGVSLARAATVTVSTTVDEVNGNTASITLLIGTPGGAGISLREAVIAANNTAGADTITLTNGTYTLTRSGNDATSSNGDLDINDHLTINGSGPASTIIQGATDASFTGTIGDKVLGINQDGTHLGLAVTISGVTIRYGNNSVPSGDPTFAYTGGGVDVFLTGTNNAVTFNNCVITGNRTTNSYGGGVNVDSSTSGLGGDPAVNTVNRGTVRFFQCNISNNRSKEMGGGINLFADIHNVVFDNCVITNNAALGTAGTSGAGGGIDIRHTYGGTVTVSNSTLILFNTSGGWGGGVSVLGSHIGPVILKDSTISGNTCLSNGASASMGGGIYSQGRSVALTNMNISNNHSDTPGSGGENPEGGGICNDFGFMTLSGNCVITNNTSVDGAGFFNRTAEATGMITGAIISGNLAKNNGGGVNVSNGVVMLDGVTIQGNTADSDGSGAGNGGGIYRASGTLSLSNTITIGGASAGQGNTAVNGGGIANASRNLAFSVGQLTGNKAKSNGGGMYVSGGSVTSSVPIRGNQADSDSSGAGDGGGIYNAGGTIVIASNSAIGGLSGGQPNTARNGGGVANASGSITYAGISPSGGTLLGNSATSNGGAGVVSGGAVYMSGLVIQSNAAATAGGAFYVSAGTLTTLYSRIVGNSAASARGIAQSGGAVTATNNWWGTNAPAALMSGAVTSTPWLLLHHTASPATIRTNASTTLTASFVTNSAGTAIPAGNLFLLVGLPISFANAQLGTLSGAQTTIQASGNATANFNAGPTGGIATVEAVVDAGISPASITVQQGPSFTFVPANITSNNTPGLCSAVVTFAPSATGYPPVGLTFSTPSGSVFPTGSTGVTATATNGVLPNATCSFTVTVVDAEAPIISCPADVIATEDPMGSGGANVRFLEPSASDNCSGIAVITPPSDSLFPVGTNIVTNTATDLAGNIATCKFNVVVRPATNDAFRLIVAEPQGNDLSILWATPGGRTNTLQVSVGGSGGGYTDNFVDVVGATQLVVAPLGDTVTNFVIIGGVTNSPARYYRVRSSQ
jgi:hypothetical protein